jgi:DNA-binding IscR family transcriptional regulator
VLVALKGHGGGFALARSPRDVSFADVLAALDLMPAQDYCAFGFGRCDPRNPCALHPAWSTLNEAFVRWAETTTLADV